LHFYLFPLFMQLSCFFPQIASVARLMVNSNLSSLYKSNCFLFVILHQAKDFHQELLRLTCDEQFQKFQLEVSTFRTQTHCNISR
jgi:hypothetical protein